MKTACLQSIYVGSYVSSRFYHTVLILTSNMCWDTATAHFLWISTLHLWYMVLYFYSLITKVDQTFVESFHGQQTTHSSSKLWYSIGMKFLYNMWCQKVMRRRWLEKAWRIWQVCTYITTVHKPVCKTSVRVPCIPQTQTIFTLFHTLNLCTPIQYSQGVRQKVSTLTYFLNQNTSVDIIHYHNLFTRSYQSLCFVHVGTSENHQCNLFICQYLFR